MTELVRDPNVKLLCPNTLAGPTNQLHTQAVEVEDRAYAKLFKDSDGEWDDKSEAGRVFLAVMADAWMRMYVDTTVVRTQGRNFYVTTAYWRCRTCGLIIPAVAKTEPGS